jgi:hypothetical protein
MVKRHQIMFDGVNLKSVSPWDVDSMAAWTILGGQQDAQGLEKLALRVPWLYRAWKDRANNVGDMPWTIERGDTEIANSAEWAEDKPRELEFISNPRKLFAQIEKSLCIAGKAYLALEVNKSGYIKNVKYLAPQTIEEVYDKQTGDITGYKRTINGNTFECSLASEPPVAGQVQIVAIYDPDWMTEIGPGNSSDALAALTAAGVLYSYDTFVANFFERGAIKASVLTVESASPGEQERLQHWWDDVVAGVKNAWSAIVLRGKMNAPVVIGEGLDGVENNELTTTRRQDICAAMGVPESRMWSAAANYATRKVDEVAYFRGTIIPDCNLIAEAMNEQIFSDVHKLNGYRIEFTPESLDIFQEDESERASSLQQLTGAGVPLITAMEILGYDLTDEQWDALKVEEEKPEPVPIMVPPAVPTEEEPEVEDEQPAVPARDIEPATRAMLKNWKRKAIHALKLTRDPNVPWDTDLLPAATIDGIRADLAACETREQIEGVFDRVVIDNETMQPVPSIADEPLVGELKRATDILERIMALPVQEYPARKAIEPQQFVKQYFTVTPAGVTVVQAPAPEVKVINEAQPAPIINVQATAPIVNVAVEPTPVQIQNEVVVKPSQSARVTRDANGRITGLEAE